MKVGNPSPRAAKFRFCPGAGKREGCIIYCESSIPPPSRRDHFCKPGGGDVPCTQNMQLNAIPFLACLHSARI